MTIPKNQPTTTAFHWATLGTPPLTPPSGSHYRGQVMDIHLHRNRPHWYIASQSDYVRYYRTFSDAYLAFFFSYRKHRSRKTVYLKLWNTLPCNIHTCGSQYVSDVIFNIFYYLIYIYNHVFLFKSIISYFKQELQMAITSYIIGKPQYFAWKYLIYINYKIMIVAINSLVSKGKETMHMLYRNQIIEFYYAFRSYLFSLNPGTMNKCLHKKYRLLVLNLLVL